MLRLWVVVVVRASEVCVCGHARLLDVRLVVGELACLGDEVDDVDCKRLAACVCDGLLDRRRALRRAERDHAAATANARELRAHSARTLGRAAEALEP